MESYVLGTSNYLCSSIAITTIKPTESEEYTAWVPVRFSTSQVYGVNRTGKGTPQDPYKYGWKNSWGANSDGAANTVGNGSVRLILTF